MRRTSGHKASSRGRPLRRSGSRARGTTRACPAHTIEYYLRQAGLTLNQIDNVVFYDKPFLKFERLVDCLARIQTVRRETNPRYHALLGAFKERTSAQTR
jgi:predicted NodU family carbamoyl transferase